MSNKRDQTVSYLLGKNDLMIQSEVVKKMIEANQEVEPHALADAAQETMELGRELCKSYLMGELLDDDVPESFCLRMSSVAAASMVIPAFLMGFIMLNRATPMRPRPATEDELDRAGKTTASANEQTAKEMMKLMKADGVPMEEIVEFIKEMLEKRENED